MCALRVEQAPRCFCRVDGAAENLIGKRIERRRSARSHALGDEIGCRARDEVARPAAVRIIDALDAAGRDVILLETVGTGQSEIDVAEVADVRVVISAPGLGDDIQAMKSGLLEIADIMVVNKGDRPGAEQTMQQLLGAFSIRAMRHRSVPVLKTTATTGEGVPELVAAVTANGRALDAAGPMARRRRRARYLIARAASDLVAERVRAGGPAALDTLADQVLSGTIGPAEAARRLLDT